jgi:hypothetical protein
MTGDLTQEFLSRRVQVSSASGGKHSCQWARLQALFFFFLQVQFILMGIKKKNSVSQKSTLLA